MTGDDFAELLRELKERSGLSYGALGKRLHMSASTVHRYVSGDVVPTDYAPVERLARICRATPEELLELHRRWVRADALRGVRRESGAAAGEPVTEAVEETAPVEGPEKEPRKGPEREGEREAEKEAAEEAEKEAVPVAATTARSRPAPALLAGVGIAAVAAATALVVSLVPGGSGGGPDTTGAAATASVGPSASRTDSSAAPTKSASPSPPKSHSATPSDGPSSDRRTTGPARGQGQDKAEPGAVPVTVATVPYYWELPCDQHFLVNRSPGNVLPPPSRQNAVGWATALGAVAADHQMVALTVQGTGAETVVLEAMHVRVVRSDTPLTWNRYAMGDGCGGEVNTKSFDVALDMGTPLVHPIAGQRNFPYKVSESDPEVFYVNAHTSGHDVSWYLELDWSSGGRQGTVRIDDHGKPFRTSGARKEYYSYPLGGGNWVLMPGD